MHGNYLKGSIRNAGLDPDDLPESDPSKMNFGGDARKAWKDIWGCGQGIGAVKEVVPAARAGRAARRANTTQARRRVALSAVPASRHATRRALAACAVSAAVLQSVVT